MATKFFRLRTSRLTRVFAVTGIVLALGLNFWFPIIGVNSFAHRVVLYPAQTGFVADYPRFLAVIAEVDNSSAIAYHGKRDGGRSLWLYVGDLDVGDFEIRGTSAKPHVLLIADCGWIDDAVNRQGRGILLKKPFDEKAFRKLPLTSVQRAVLRLQYWGMPMRIVGAPAEYETLDGLVYIHFRVLLASSYAPPLQ